MALGKDSPVKFRVIIAGGGIAGLTLANALQHAGIEYLILESRDEIAPQVGASIGLGPNGSRILDQLGCYDNILRLTRPIAYTASHKPDGSLIRPRTDAFQLVQARANYCMCFLDRQAVLRVLADHILDKSKLLLKKRVVNVIHEYDGVTVICGDQSSYRGDIIIGADGVHSKVRSEMWRTADATTPGDIPDEEKNSMISEYKCLFGISTPVPGLPSQHFDITYTKDLSPIVITGKNDRVYWFLIARMEDAYKYGNIPRFTREEARNFAEANLSIPLAPGGQVTFRDLWDRQEVYNLVALEEACFSHWSWGRFACLGDSVHKMTPNMGAGGNAAIESAAVLANCIHELVSHKSDTVPNLEQVRNALRRYQNERNLRASANVAMSNYVTRLHAVRGLFEKLMAYYIMPRAGDLLVDMASLSWIGAARLNFMPLPMRSLGGTMPFNPQQGLGKLENLWVRAIIALPFLGVAAYHVHVLHHCLPRLPIRAAVDAGMIHFNTTSVTLMDHFYGIPWLDSVWKGIVPLFLPSIMGLNQASAWQMWIAFADFGTIYAIMLVESARRALVMTPMRIPFLFALAAQLLGAGTILPIYFFLYSSAVSISWFRASDMRLTDLSYTRTILPVMILLYYLPYVVAFLGSTTNARQSSIWIFQLSPLWVSLGQWTLAKTIMTSTIAQDRVHNVKRDLPVVFLTVGLLGTWSAISWLGTILTAPLFIYDIFRPPFDSRSSLETGIHNVLWNDHVFFVGASLLWILYLFRDLKNAHMVQLSWLSIISLFLVFGMVLGPMGLVACAWLYREYMLSTRRHWGAVSKLKDLHHLD